ncbi:hypothetical protein HMPREF0670_01467 [Prevotella sp. oral taxon 317 str. F0108]|nr:hypothetical protein HMPREF0670_01467 [Prevotella sp. oral taxon 317 str. F0108]
MCRKVGNQSEKSLTNNHFGGVKSLTNNHSGGVKKPHQQPLSKGRGA